jgi:trigger factor
MTLKISTEPQENRQLEVKIEVDQARVDEQLRRAARKLAGEYRIPGFRRGKVPYHILVQYLGEHTLYNEFVERLGQEVYGEAVETGEFEPYAQASLNDISFEPLTYILSVPLEPIVELGDYRSLRVEEEAPEVDEEEVTQQLDSYREQYAGWQDVDRPSTYGDMLNIDVKSVIPADGDEEETVVLDESDWDVTPDQENPMEPPGFDEALIGMTPGEEKEFTLSWPEESQSIYAGKTAQFSVKLNSIQAYEKPELNDEFAQLVGPDFETLDDLMNNIRETLREQAEAEAENNYLEKVLDSVMEQATLDYPPVVVEDQIDSMVNEFAQRLQQFGIGDIEAYFDQVGQSLDEYRESLREQAEIAARRNLIISELWKLEQITATDDDLDAKIQEIIGNPEDEAADEDTDVTVDAEQDAVAEAAVTPEVGDAESDADDAPVEESGEEVEAEAVDLEAESDRAADAEAAEDESDADERLDEAFDNNRALADMFRNGPGRQILEAQIVQEKAIERLLAIARGEDVPDLPEPSAEDVEVEEEAAAVTGEEGDDAGADGGEESDAESDVEATVARE